MRCSGWSSLAISVCSALLLAAPAAAHVYPRPSYVEGGRTSTISLSVPNEREAGMTSIEITAPDGFRMIAAQPPAGWTAEVNGRVARWSGAPLPARGSATLTLELRAPAESGDVELTATERFADGGTVTWPVALTVVPGDEPGQHLGAALAAGVIAILGLTAAGLFLWQRRVRSLQER